jgi:hypothetical protein
MTPPPRLRGARARPRPLLLALVALALAVAATPAAAANANGGRAKRVNRGQQQQQHHRNRASSSQAQIPKVRAAETKPTPKFRADNPSAAAAPAAPAAPRQVASSSLVQGDATWYTGIFAGYCEFFFSNLPADRFVAALPSVSPTTPPIGAACGDCLAVFCRRGVVTDLLGTVNVDRSDACRDENTGIVVKVTDTCSCPFNQMWCCGSGPDGKPHHVDLSQEAFAALAKNADVGLGVMAIEWGAIPCSFLGQRVTRDGAALPVVPPALPPAPYDPVPVPTPAPAPPPPTPPPVQRPPPVTTAEERPPPVVVAVPTTPARPPTRPPTTTTTRPPSKPTRPTGGARPTRPNRPNRPNRPAAAAKPTRPPATPARPPVQQPQRPVRPPLRPARPALRPVMPPQRPVRPPQRPVRPPTQKPTTVSNANTVSVLQTCINAGACAAGSPLGTSGSPDAVAFEAAAQALCPSPGLWAAASSTPLALSRKELARFEQCGGAGGACCAYARPIGGGERLQGVCGDAVFAGRTCAAGTTCQRKDAWYWQCV